MMLLKYHCQRMDVMHCIKYEIKDRVMFVELHRPDVLNAINLNMIHELTTLFQDAENTEDVSVIIVKGSGDRAFSSGGDLLEFHSITTFEATQNMMNSAKQLLDVIASSSKLTIAAINGYALGGGAELTTAFDVRVASMNAKIGFVQSNLGITTAWGGGSRLISIIGHTHALPILIKGEILPASKWAELGFIDRLFSIEKFEEESMNYALDLASKSPQVLKAYKKLALPLIHTEVLERAIEEEVRQAIDLWLSDEHMQAASRALQKLQR